MFEAGPLDPQFASHAVYEPRHEMKRIGLALLQPNRLGAIAIVADAMTYIGRPREGENDFGIFPQPVFLAQKQRCLVAFALQGEDVVAIGFGQEVALQHGGDQVGDGVGIAGRSGASGLGELGKDARPLGVSGSFAPKGVAGTGEDGAVDHLFIHRHGIEFRGVFLSPEGHVEELQRDAGPRFLGFGGSGEGDLTGQQRGESDEEESFHNGML